MILSNSCYLKNKCYKYNKKDKTCQDCAMFCPKLFRTDFLLSEALIPDNQKPYLPLVIDLDGTDREEFLFLKAIENNILDFVKSGKNLYIHSKNTGTGKSSWAIRLIQAYIDKIWYSSDLVCKALFINVPRFLLDLKDNISNKSEYIEHIKKYALSADVVVFDEVATKTMTQFEHENILSIINARIDMGKSNIYTSNVSGEELREKMGDRLFSRIFKFSDVVEFHGSDKRGLAGGNIN